MASDTHLPGISCVQVPPGQELLLPLPRAPNLSPWAFCPVLSRRVLIGPFLVGSLDVGAWDEGPGPCGTTVAPPPHLPWPVTREFKMCVSVFLTLLGLQSLSAPKHTLPFLPFRYLNDVDNAHWSLFGYCPQEDALDDLLTVEEHMYYYARLHGIPEKHIKGVSQQRRSLPLGQKDRGSPRLERPLACLGHRPDRLEI